MKIKVSKYCIDNSSRKDAKHCMIVQAIRRANPDARNISVDLQSIQWSDRVKGKRYIVLTPVKAQKSLIAFDNGKHVDPFAFNVIPEQGLIKKIGWAAPKPTRRLVKYKITKNNHKRRAVAKRELGINMVP